MEIQKNKSGRPFVEEKAKNINVYVQPSKVSKLGQRKTALLLKEIAELVNENESITLTIVRGEIIIKPYKAISIAESPVCSASCVSEMG